VAGRPAFESEGKSDILVPRGGGIRSLFYRLRRLLVFDLVRLELDRVTLIPFSRGKGRRSLP